MKEEKRGRDKNIEEYEENSRRQKGVGMRKRKREKGRGREIRRRRRKGKKKWGKFSNRSFCVVTFFTSHFYFFFLSFYFPLTSYSWHWLLCYSNFDVPKAFDSLMDFLLR